MKIMRGGNVLDDARKRVRWVFDEFPDVVVCMSGGKDSTIVLELALEENRRRGGKPLKVMFLDQEAEWRSTVEYVRRVMSRPDVEPWWFQMPLRLSNATSHFKHWLNCWHDGEEWMREREPNAITQNVYGTTSFLDLFDAILAYHFPETKCCYLAGVRAEESPTRRLGLTHYASYKWATWGRKIDVRRQHFNLYPIYDWSYRDVWKAIHDHGWDYNVIYDEQYRKGLPITKMRVSNLHHETAIEALYYLQEIETDTWNALCKRLPGINTAKHMTGESMRCPKTLPWMFANWREYRDHLLKHLPCNDEIREKFAQRFAVMDRHYDTLPAEYGMLREQISALLINDYHHVKVWNWERKREVRAWYVKRWNKDTALTRLGSGREPRRTKT